MSIIKAEKFADYGYVQGRCDRCTEQHMPLTKYPRTNEWLCQKCLISREYEPEAKEKIKKGDEDTEFFRYITSV